MVRQLWIGVDWRRTDRNGRVWQSRSGEVIFYQARRGLAVRVGNVRDGFGVAWNDLAWQLGNGS